MLPQFEASEQPTVGIELELQLLDAGTLDLIDGIVPLIELYPEQQFVKPEFFQSSVEITSPPCANTGEARRHLLRTLSDLMVNCARLGMTLCGGGTHTFDRRLALITPLRRYQELEAAYGYVALTQLTFSTHVHVGMPSGDAAIFVMRQLTPCLPALLAAAANSPFWRGYDTGYAAYRSCILTASEMYGLPEYFDDWADFIRFYEAAQRAGIWSQIRDIHWDLRPRPDYGTLELRVMDAASTVRTAAALAAFVRCLMVYLIRHVGLEVDECLPRPLPHWLEHINRYRAGHLGLEAEYICDEEGRTRPLREVISELIALMRPVARSIDEAAGLTDFESLLDQGTGYTRQRDSFAEHGMLPEVTRGLVADLRREADAA